MENGYIVYMHISPSNKRYIGLTKQKPEHRWDNGNGYKTQRYFYRAIEKYGWDNFQHIIVARGLDEETAKWLEIELIREWDSTNPNKGYNITLGGDGCSGYQHSEEFKKEQSERNSGENNPFYGKHHTEETRRKISETSKGKQFSEEHKEKISKANSGENNYWFGKQLSEEHKEKISKANSGKPSSMKGKQHSEEAKQKMSEIKKGKYKGENNPMAKTIILLNTKEIFTTIKEGAEKYNVSSGHISQCCNGKRKSAGKLNGEKMIWMYYKDYLLLKNK